MSENAAPPKTAFFEKFCFFYMGFMVVSNYNAFVSNRYIFTSVYGGTAYYLMNLSLSLPQILVYLFSPEILNKASAKTIYNCNMAVQVMGPAIHIAIIAVIGDDLKAGQSTITVTLVVIYTTLLLSSVFIAIVQILLLGIATFNRQIVQIHITGMSSSNLVFSLYLLLIDQITESPVNRNTLRYCFSVLVYIVGFPLYRHIARTSAARRKAAGLETEARVRKEKIGREVYAGVFREKWHFLALNFGLFFFAFLCYPTLMYISESSNPKFESWGTVLQFLFGVSELCARTLNTLDLRRLRGLVRASNVRYFSLFAYACSLVLVIAFLAMRGHVSISVVARDVLNGIFYGILAFNLGFLGNNLAGFAHEGMAGAEINVIGSFFNFSIATSIFFGSGVSTLLAKFVKSK